MKRWIIGLAAAVGVSVLMLLGTSAGAADRSHRVALGAQHAHVSVDPLLIHRLTSTPGGRVDAIVTAWSRRGLPAIERLGVRGARLQALPMILTESLTRGQLARLRRSAHVRSVWANRTFRTYMEDTTWITKARYAWPASSPSAPGPAALNVTGKDVHLAVIDTGADGQHEDMDNLVEFCETTGAVTSNHTSVLCSPFNPAAENLGPACPLDTARDCATDDDGHGSHVSGTIAGSGQASGGRNAHHSTIGMAPDAKLHVYSANVGPALAAHEILSSYDDMINKKVLGISRVVAVNNSWGGGTGSSYSPNSPQSIAFKRAYDAGILSVFAAGNSGPEHNTLSGQCISPWVACVAASTKPDSIVAFSSKGRPSEPADTNRDGVVGGPGDIAPANHDRKIAQAFDVGVYRPALAAPGVNIDSISANSPTCREGGATPDTGCYESLNGTSMATPHVTGAVGLIVEAYRQGHKGATPMPSIITDILERSANVSKLPGWESEEQGAGRLNAYEAVRLAKTYPNGLPRPNFGTPSAPYQADRYPGSAGSRYTEKGCTGTASWSVGNTAKGPLPVEPPPGSDILLPRYGGHVIDVPANVERLRVTVRWPRHPTANIYARLWRPGVDPDAEFQPVGPSRVFPDAEAIGIPVGTPPTFRLIDLRAPEAATLEEGKWILRVYHRVGGAPLVCDSDSKESPKQEEGFNYTLTVEMPAAALAPAAAITSPLSGSTVSGRFVQVAGTATYPTPWNGVTNWEVAGTGNPALGPEEPDTRPVLHFHGNGPAPHASGEPDEVFCTGDGASDFLACDGPFLIPEPAGANLSSQSAASWKVPDPLFNTNAARGNLTDPNWIWKLSSPVSLSGPMTVEWWASCGACSRTLGIDADWTIRVWADGAKAFEQRLTAAPATPNVAERLSATVSLPPITANESIVLHVDPVYIDSQLNTFVYYDSAGPCQAGGTAPCDSIVRMPVVQSASSGTSSKPGTPTNVRVTDRHSGLTVAWDAVSGASGYEIYRSTNPEFAPTPKTRIATTTGAACDSPSVPAWPTASRSGLCYTDGKAALQRTYYYRVVAKEGKVRGDASLLAYGDRTEFDRQVKLKVDRLYGPQYSEYAVLGSATGTKWSFTWDTLELITGTHSLSARSFTQGIGAEKSDLTVTLSG